MLAALIVATVLGSQSASMPGRNCTDDNGRDVCAAEAQARRLERLGVTPAEVEAAGGVESYRAFFVDGYGRDMPALAFERRAGNGPVSVVYGFEGARMEAPVSPKT